MDVITPDGPRRLTISIRRGALQLRARLGFDSHVERPDWQGAFWRSDPFRGGAVICPAFGCGHLTAGYDEIRDMRNPFNLCCGCTLDMAFDSLSIASLDTLAI